MIGKLKGLIDSYGEDFVILDVGGVGYQVHCSARTLQALPAPGEAAVLSIETYVREDLIKLFGFRSDVEREWFRLLQTVQGVGAKVALAVLGTLPPAELANAIALRDKAMIARSGPQRRRCLKVCALATGLGDKAVSLVYERVLRKDKHSKIWVERCETQIGAVLDVLEQARANIASPYWFGEKIGHADIALACVLRFTGEAHPQLFDAARYPALGAHAARCEALAVFAEIAQPLIPPSGD